MGEKLGGLMLASAFMAGYLALGTAMHGFPGTALLFTVLTATTAMVGFANLP